MQVGGINFTPFSRLNFSHPAMYTGFFQKRPKSSKMAKITHVFTVEDIEEI